MSTTTQDIIEREIIVNAPKERVYAAITDPTQLVKWFPDGIEGSLEPGERPIFDFGEYGKFQIYIVSAEPNDYFAYRWIPGGSFMPNGFLGDVLEKPHTLVEFRLSEAPNGTRVRLIESGFASLPSGHAEQALKDNVGGWEYMLDRLEKLINGA